MELDRVLDHVNELNTDTPKVKCDREGVSPDLVFGLDTQLFKVTNGKTREMNELVFDPKHQENEVDLIQVVQQTPGALNKEALETFLKGMPKDDIYRIKGFIRLDDGLHILNHAFGRHTLTLVENQDTLEEAKGIQIKVTVMGQDLRMYTDKIKKGLLTAEGEITLTPAHRH